MSDHRLQTCREVIAFLHDYLDGLLPPQRRDELDRHLESCPSCRHYLDGYRRTMAACAGAHDEPAELPEELVAAILAARRGGG